MPEYTFTQLLLWNMKQEIPSYLGEYTTKEESPLFKDLDRQIDAEKNVLLETIAATKATISVQMNTLNKKAASLDAQLSGKKTKLK